MYPLLLKAPVKASIWGGMRLIEEFGFETENKNAAEAWLLSCHKDGNCIVRNGEFKGLTLSHTIEIMGAKALGKNVADFSYFPIMIKLIDAKDRLSVQVHPDDEYALIHAGTCGKTKLIYIIDCEDDAKIIYGFKQNVSKGEFFERINKNNLSPVCNYVPVKKGDLFFIEPGTMHAIGKGILAAEISQSSTVGYRISDYGRVGADGKPRQLQIKQALEVTKTDKPQKAFGNVGEVEIYPFGTVRTLASCSCFKTELIKLNGNVGIYDNDSFVSMVILDGEANLSYAQGTMRVKKGDSVFLPAGVKVRLSGKAEILHTHL